MAKFVEALESPIQRSGEFWQQATGIMESCPSPKLIASADGESQFISTPSVNPIEDYSIRNKFSDKDGGNEEALKIYSQKYAVAARTEDGSFSRDLPLFLIVNNNYASPILQFQRNVDTITILDSVFSELDDGQQYVPSILKVIENKCVNDKNALVRVANDRKDRVRGWIKGTAIGLTILAAAGTGGGIFLKHKFDEESARNQERIEFDNQNISIHTSSVIAGDLAYVPSELSFFGEQLPEPTQDDTYLHPRKLIMDSACKAITHVNPKTQAVRAVTDASNEKMFLAVNSAGDTQVCFFGNAPGSQETKPRIAIQVVDRAKQ